MAKSERHRILHGGSFRSTNSDHVLKQWSKNFAKYTTDDEDTSEIAGAQRTASSQRTVSEQKSSMPRNNPKTSALARDERRNKSSSREGHNQASEQDVDLDQEIDMNVLPESIRPHRDAMKEFVQLLSQVQPTLSKVLEVCSQHTKDLDNVEAIFKENKKLQGEIKEQMGVITRLDSTLNSTLRVNEGERKRLEDTKKELEAKEGRLTQQHEEVNQKLAEQKAKQEKDLAVERKNHSGELKRLEADLLEKFAAKERHLETTTADEIRRAAQEHKIEQERLNLQRKTAEAGLESLEMQLALSREENAKLIQQNRDTGLLREILDDKNKKLEQQWNGFSTGGQPLTDYTKKFKEIENEIQKTASNYLRNIQSLSAQEHGKIQQILSDADSLFRGVPITDTEDSSRLCRAHIQRVIALNVVQTIWKPFSCDRLVDQDGISELLLEMEWGVAAETHMGSCQHVFWTTRTCQALQNLHFHEDASQPKTLSKNAPSLHAKATTSSSARVEKTYLSIMSVIRPLIEEADLEDFQRGLTSILEDCVTIWDQATTDKMWFEAQVSLNSECYDGCRSQEFDPVSESEKDGLQADDAAGETTESSSTLVCTPSSSDERLTLFPLVRVRHPDDDNHGPADHTLPGSFPEEGGTEEQARMIRDTRKIEVLHPGSALAMTSDLVATGMKAVEDRLKYLEGVLNAADEQYRSRNTKHRQNSSVWSVTTLGMSVGDPE